MSLSLEHFKKKALEDEETRAEYKRLQPEFDAIRQLVALRKAANLSQEEMVRRMGTTKSAISRLESRSRKHSPKWETLEKYARAAGYRPVLQFVPQDGPM